MKWFFITPFTINVLNISLLIAFMLFLLSKNRKKSLATRYLIGFLAGVLLVFVSFVLIFSSTHPLASTVAWWAIHLMVFASVAMVQFAYHFPRNIHPSESRFVLMLTLAAAAAVYPYYIYRTLSMEPAYSFEGSLYAYFHTPEIGVVIGLEIIWIVILFIRKSIIFSTVGHDTDTVSHKNFFSRRLHGIFNLTRIDGKEAKALRNLALIFISPVILIFVIILAYLGYMSWEIVANILGTSFIIAVFLFVVLYINNAPEPSTFMIKLVGISLGGILIALGIASNIAFSAKQEAYHSKKYLAVELLKTNRVSQQPIALPGNISYVASWPKGGSFSTEKPTIIYKKSNGLTPLQLLKSNATINTGVFTEKSTTAIRHGYRSIHPLRPETFYTIYLFDHQGKTVEIGYRYMDYRAYLHGTGLKLMIIILGSFTFVIVVMPFMFRESIARPLKLLLEGVRQINQGSLEVAVPVRVEDEIGYLSRSFNNMVISIRDAEKKLKDSLEYQVRLTDSYSCFVPREFLNFLKKESVIDIKLGDNVQEEMTILFSDIRSFTQLSERMSPQENFNFLNSCLRRLGPVVRKNNGFIDKYIGDAVMALFPRSPDDAVQAAVDMQRAVKEYNIHRERNGYDPVDIGIGMHTGVLMLGTIGEEKRMEGTVISDTVNLASRIESLTKVYGAPMIASDVTMNALTANDGINYRYLDRVKVKGKNRWVDIYEIIDNQFDSENRLKMDTKKDFEKGVRLYQTKNIPAALACFQTVLSANPEDKAALLYHNRCLHFHEHGVPDEWDGISTLTEK